MQLSHAHPVRSIRFDDPNLVSSTGLVPVMALAQSAGLRALVDAHLSVPTDKGANAGLKVSSTLGSFLREFTFGHYASSTRSPHDC